MHEIEPLNNSDLERIHVGIIAGDIAAQQEFESAVRPYALGIAIRTGVSIDDAEEIWNDAFRIGLERASTIMPPGRRLRAFVLSITRTAAVDRIRLRVRRNEVALEDDDGESGSAAAPGPLPSSLSQNVLASLTHCIEAASDLHREVMTMAANRLTAAEIAGVLHVTEANAAKIRERARNWFRKCLEGVGL